MAENEFYRLDIVINTTGDEQAKGKLKAMDKFIEHTRKRGEMLNRMRISPAVRLVDRFSAPARKIQSTLQRLGGVRKITLKAVDKVTGVVRRIARLFTSPLALLGVSVSGAAAFAGMVKAPLELAGNMEQARIGFTTMLGSAEKATAFLKELQLFAAKTPFEFPQLQESSRLLLAFGFAAQDVVPMMTAIGNAAAGLGVGAEGIDRAVRALGQMRAKGKVSAEEIMQLTEIGIPAYDILQKKFGLSAKQMENLGKAGITADAAIRALIEGMNERFKDMMRNQSLTLFGLWSTIKDTFSIQILYRWGEGLRKAIQPKVLQLVEWFEKNEATVERWGNMLEQTAREAAEALTRNIERAFRWIRNRYLDNPEFQRLDIQGKISYVFGDLIGTFSAWLAGQGGKQIVEIGKQVGTTFGRGVVEGLLEAIKSNPLAAVLIGGFVGFKVGGPKGGLIGAGVALTVNIVASGGNPIPLMNVRESVTQAANAGSLPRTKQTRYAYGGIVAAPRLALVAESGPEAIIPLSPRMRSRALALYEETGRRLGVGLNVAPPRYIPETGIGTRPNVTNNIYVYVTSAESADPDRIAEAIAIKLERVYHNMP